MEKNKAIEIMVNNGWTKTQAKKNLILGTTIYENFEEDFEKTYKEQWEYLGEEYIENIRKMIETREPMRDWGIVEYEGKIYYIEYGL